MTRRDFLSTAIATTFGSSLFANKKQKIVNIKMKGDLDDDLFVIKTSPKQSEMIVCKQMHNPKEYFNYRGNMVKSTPIYGVINHNKNYTIKDNEILSIMLANEREEINDLPTLRSRTHFKAVNLYANDNILIPSLMPEWNDVPGYPVWFSNGEEYCSTFHKDKSYNYYKLWENAICGTGIIVPFIGKIKIKLYNINNINNFTYSFYLNKNEVKHIISDEVIKGLCNKHLLCESDYSIFDGEKDTDDERVKTVSQEAAQKMVIEHNSNIFTVDFPYPMPYPNRIFIKNCYYIV